MKQTLTILIALIAFNTYGQYYKTKITFTNGEITEGYATLPTDALFENTNYKEALNTETKSIKSDDIASITYHTNEGNEYVFERLQVRFLNKSFGKYYDKIRKGKRWMLIVFSDPLIKFYCWAPNFSMDSAGVITATSKGNRVAWGEIPLYLRRPDEPAAAQITTLTSMDIISEQNHFRKIAAYYFQNEPQLVKRIEAKEFTNDNLIKLVEAYIAIKKNTISQK